MFTLNVPVPPQPHPAVMAKALGLDGFLHDDLTYFGVFGAPGGSAAQSNAWQDIEQLRGWNHTAIMAKAFQFAMASMTVYCSPAVAEAIRNRTGDDADQNSQVRGTEGYQVPSTWVVAPEQHPIVQLLRQPNPWCNEALFKFQLAQQIETHGVCHVLVLRNGLGQPKQLWVIPRTCIEQVRPSRHFPGGSYRIRNLSVLGGTAIGEDDSDEMPRTRAGMLAWLSNREYPAESVIPIGVPSPLFADDHLNMTSVISDALDTDRAIHQSRRNTLENQASMGPVFEETPGVTLSPEERQQVMDDWMAQHAGPENAGMPWFRPQGVQMKLGGFNSREMEFAASTAQMRDDILGQRMTPPQLVGLGANAGYAGVVATIKGWARMTGQPLMLIAAGQLTIGLQACYEGDPESSWCFCRRPTSMIRRHGRLRCSCMWRQGP